MVELIVRPYAPEDRAAWDAFIARSKNGTFLFMRGFMDYHSERFVDASALVTDAGGRLLALFPANRSSVRITSHAGLSYGGMICDETMLAPLALDIFAAWFTHCRAQGAEEIVYKAVPPIYHRMPADEDRYALFYHGAALYRRDMTQTVDLVAQA
ncbi:MAG: GNAT family N-acetyltransferase, partial [Rubrivivax sp.]|nr:GNAT family N-acetyltransferase [Rubrivivax sp.]